MSTFEVKITYKPFHSLITHKPWPKNSKPYKNTPNMKKQTFSCQRQCFFKPTRGNVGRKDSNRWSPWRCVLKSLYHPQPVTVHGNMVWMWKMNEIQTVPTLCLPTPVGEDIKWPRVLQMIIENSDGRLFQ